MDSDREEEAKKQRKYDETVCCEINFNVLSIHGSVNPKVDSLPSRLTVKLVPASFKRLLKARRAIDSGVSIAGCHLRNNDFITDNPNMKLHWGKLLVSEGSSGRYQLDAECFCRMTHCFLQADREVDESWFDEILT